MQSKIWEPEESSKPKYFVLFEHKDYNAAAMKAKYLKEQGKEIIFYKNLKENIFQVLEQVK